MSKEENPSFTPGLSQFQEEEKLILGRWSNPFQKKRKTLLIWLEGASKCFELLSPKKIDPNYWSKEDAKKFVAKTVAKSKSEQKAITTWQFAILAVLIGATLALMVFMAVRMNIF